jgi:hypothetical protein
MSDDRIELTPIGRVESTLTDRAAAPMQGNEGAPAAWLVFDDAVLESLDDVKPVLGQPFQAACAGTWRISSLIPSGS